MLHAAVTHLDLVRRTASVLQISHTTANALQTKYGSAKGDLQMALRYSPQISWKSVQQHKFEFVIRNVSNHSIAYFWHAYWVRPSLTDTNGREMQNFADFGSNIKWMALSAQDRMVLRPGEERAAGVWLVSIRESLFSKRLKPGPYRLQGILLNPLTHSDIATKVAKDKPTSFSYWHSDALKTPKATVFLINTP